MNPEDLDAAAAKVAGTMTTDPIDAAARQVVDDQRTQAKSSLYNALLENPDMAARAQHLGRKAGLPSDVVQRNLPDVERQVYLNDVDNLLESHPGVVQFLSSPQFAALAHDDVDNLGAMEKTLQGFRNVGGAALSGLYRASGGVVGAIQAPFDVLAPLADPLAGTLLPENPLRRVGAGLAEYRQGINYWAEHYMPKAESVAGAGVYSGVASLSTNLAALPLLFAGPSGQRAYMAQMVTPVAGGEYGKAKDKGLSTLQALTYGVSQAAVEYATEKLPMVKLIGDLKVGAPLYRVVANQLATEIPGEQLATVLQDLNEWAALNPEKPFKDYIAERPSAAAQTLIATMIGVGGQVSTVKGIEAMLTMGEKRMGAAQTDPAQVAQSGMIQTIMEGAAQMRLKSAEAAVAEEQAQVLGTIVQLAQSSKLAQRDPAALQEFVRQVTEDSPVQDVYVNAQTLYQAAQEAGISDAQLPENIRTQLPEALASGGDLRISLTEFASTIAPTQYAQGLLDHLKVDPMGMSRAEAKVYLQTQVEDLRQQVDKAMAGNAQEADFKVQIDQVRGEFKAQLDTANRFTAEVNDNYANLLANFYGVTAAKVGTTPAELVKRYPLRVQAEGVQGAASQYDQDRQYPLAPRGEWYGEGTFREDGARMVYVTPDEYIAAVRPLTMDDESRENIDLLKKHIQDGKTLDPLLIRANGKEDGRHRAYAAKELGIAQVPVIAYGEQFAGAPEVDSRAYAQSRKADERDLVVTHNLTAENLLHAQKMGGLAVPSLAITRKDTPLTNFGEITLVGDEKMADPKGYASTKVFGADIYSPRYPSVERDIDTKAQVALSKKFKPMADRMGITLPATTELQREGQRELERNLAVMGQFLRDNGIEPTLIERPGMKPEREARLVEFGMGPFLDVTDQWALRDDPVFFKAALAEIIDIYESLDGKRDAFVQKLKTDEDAQRNMVRDTAYEVANAAKLRQKPEVDRYETQKAMEAQVKDAELGNQFQQYVADLLEGITKSERIFQGFTYSGNRKYIPHTLENVVKLLKKELRGGENFNYGVGSLRAQYTPQFKSVAQIRASKERLISAEEFEAVKKEIDAEFLQVVSAINPDLSLDTGVAIMEDAAKKGVTRAAKDYGYELTHEVAQQVGNFLEKLRTLPTAYFEAKILRDVSLSEFKGAVVPEGTDPAVTELLTNAGVTDIKTYKKGDESDRAAKIVEFDNLFFQGNRGQIAFGGDITQVPSVITLFKGADLSTFLHESGHFFLEMQFDLASRIAGEASAFGAETNTAGEQALLKDTATLLEWFGVKDMAEWYAMPMEQKRSYHEQFARGFEAYLFEGKAPSIELQGLFQRFRAWLVRVYKDLKALNVELTDEVRSVMDRMLATSEQIDLAEKGRSMMPLFTAPEQAGMTTEEFSAYQELGTQATQDAVQDLQARTLRDLAYARNARGREIKRLQKEAEARRAEMRMEARREIMSQPVYRAWQFLTGKLDQNAKAMMAPEPVRKSVKGPVDPTVDSLFVAIAKLGGLDRQQVMSAWGWDPKERSPMPIFGKYLLRREDGLTIDGMGEVLAEYGYLPVDENGKFDQRDLEERFDAEYRGDPQYANAKEYADAQGEKRPGEDADIENMGAGRLDRLALVDIGLPAEIVQIMDNLKMTARDGIHPDLVAESFGLSSGDELVRRLAIAEAPKDAIEGLTDQKMLERYGDLATPEAIERAADAAIHNEARARFVATEFNALAKATGKPKVLASAAKEFARTMIDRLLVRNVRPSQYVAAEVRAAKASEKAMKSGDTAQAAAEKRNQLINTYAAKSAHDALTEVENGLRYLGKFNTDGTRKAIDVDYLDQIDAILERFDLRKGTSLKAIEKRKALSKWIAEQEDLGIEVELPEKIMAEAYRQSYKDLSVEEFRGLVDSVKQIEHLGRLKEKLLTAADNRRFADVVQIMTSSIEENAGDKRANNRTRDTLLSRSAALFKGFVASHRKMASLARELDGFTDGGPMWDYLIQSMNRAGDTEATMRAEATAQITTLLKPVLKAGGRMTGKGTYFPSIGESLNRGEQLVLAMNTGNAGNLQRLLDGRGWTMDQIGPVLQNLSAADWQFVQQVWDFFESYRPQIAAKERRVMGKEPVWVEPQAQQVMTKDGQQLTVRGGYFPIVYDPRESGRAEQQADAEAAKQMMKGAFVAATTKRSFTKTRAEQVTGRPLVLTWDALFRGANDVIHDLAWHEWVIDANRIIKNDQVDKAIRSTYGADVVQQFKAGIRDIAAGDAPNHDALAKALTPLRTGAAVAGLGFNLMNAMLQPLGLTQSMVRIGAKWVAIGAAEWAKSPVGLVQQVHEKSEFMRNRGRTMQRELNEIQSVVQGKGEVRQKLDALMFVPMQSLQLIADMPTWWGAYQKALAGMPVDMQQDAAEERAIALADQAVLDAQAGGQVKDLALIQRGGPMQKLFTVFYGYFSAAYNLGVERAKATNYRSPLEVMHLAWDFLLLYSVPSVLASLLKDALQPGDDDDDLARKLISEQISYLMGLMVGVREITGAVQYATGTKMFDMAYGGPAGLRFFQELDKLGKQVGQGELDRALARSVVNVGGVILHLPSGQINRTIDGVIAISEGETENPAALLFGVQK